jgi:hypothetical protein
MSSSSSSRPPVNDDDDDDDDGRFDGLYLTVAQQAQGIGPLLDTMFSVVPETEGPTFFAGSPPPTATTLLGGEDMDGTHEVLRKHAHIYRRTTAKSAASSSKKVKAKPRKQDKPT